MNKVIGLFCFLLLVSLSACQLPTKQDPSKQQIPQIPEIIKNITETPTVEITPVQLATPDCNTPLAFGHSVEQSPSNLSIQPLNPTFSWRYWPATSTFNSEIADPWMYVCSPDIHYIYLSTGPGFDDEIIHEANPNTSYSTGVINYEWMNGTQLDPLKVYRWMGTGKYHTMTYLFGYSSMTLHKEFPSFHPYTQDIFLFRTGPSCGSGSIDIPALTSPAQGTVINTTEPIFTWSASNCMPDDFKIHVWSSSGYSLDGTTDVLWWNTYTENTVIPPLPDCTLLYWQVRGRMNTVNLGDWSATRSFYVNTGNCAPPPVPPVVPTKTPTATPKPVSINCSDYTNLETCKSHSQCKWTIFPLTAFKPAVCEAKP